MPGVMLSSYVETDDHLSVARRQTGLSRGEVRRRGAPAGALREEENVSLYQSQHLHLSQYQPSGESILARFSLPRGAEEFLWRAIGTGRWLLILLSTEEHMSRRHDAGLSNWII